MLCVLSFKTFSLCIHFSEIYSLISEIPDIFVIDLKFYSVTLGEHTASFQLLETAGVGSGAKISSLLGRGPPASGEASTPRCACNVLLCRGGGEGSCWPVPVLFGTQPCIISFWAEECPLDHLWGQVWWPHLPLLSFHLRKASMAPSLLRNSIAGHRVCG